MINSQMMLVIISIMGYGLGAFFYKMSGNQGMHPLMITICVTAMYVLIMPVIFMTVNFNRQLTTMGLVLAVIGGLATGIGNLGWMYAMKTGEAGSTTTLTSLYPAVTLLLSCLFLGETFSLKKGIGMVLALIGFAILS